MGSIKKALKPVTRVVDNIIPNEIKPALPYIAATFGAPYLTPFVGKGLAGLGMKALSNSALQAGLTKGLAGGIANLGTQALLGKKINPTSALFSAATVGGGQFLKDSPFFQDSKFAKSVGEFISPDKLGGMDLKEASTAATTPLTAGTAESAYDAAKKANDEYDQYVQEQQAAGTEDIQTRVDYITRYMSLAGFGQDNIDTTLNELGYAANGGLMGTRVGYRIGGGPVKSFIAKLLNAEPSEEVLNKMFEERKKEILSGMFDAEAGTGAYSMEQMQKADEMATKQAMQELEEFKMRIGMELDNPPEGSMSDDMIDQIMDAREKSNRTPGERAKEDLLQYDSPVPMNIGDTLLDKFMLEDFQDTIKKQKEEQKEEGSRFADGGRIEYKVGGNVMGLFTGSDGSFDRSMFDAMYDEYSEDSRGKGLYEFALDFLGAAGSFGDTYRNGGRIKYAEGGTDYSPTIPFGGRTSEFFLNAIKEAKNEKDARPGYGEEERSKTVGDIIDPDSILKYLFPFDKFPKGKKKIMKELNKLLDEAERDDERDPENKGRYYDPERPDLFFMKNGGIMNLKMGGMPAEMDLRGGGFVPIGAKEKADDVPARLSKNEFVMTADAVRAAGGGSVNKGAKRMYDLMNNLEARV